MYDFVTISATHTPYKKHSPQCVCYFVGHKCPPIAYTFLSTVSLYGVLCGRYSLKVSPLEIHPTEKLYFIRFIT